MGIERHKDGVLLSVRVKPSSRRFGFSEKDGTLILEVTSPPVEGKANTEIVKTLKKLLGHDVEIASGLKGKDKRILIRGATPDEVKKKLSA